MESFAQKHPNIMKLNSNYGFYCIIQWKHQDYFKCNEKEFPLSPCIHSLASPVKAVGSGTKAESRSTELYWNQTRFGLDPTLNPGG